MKRGGERIRMYMTRAGLPTHSPRAGLPRLPLRVRVIMLVRLMRRPFRAIAKWWALNSPRAVRIRASLRRCRSPIQPTDWRAFKRANMDRMPAIANIHEYGERQRAKQRAIIAAQEQASLREQYLEGA